MEPRIEPTIFTSGDWELSVTCYTRHVDPGLMQISLRPGKGKRPGTSCSYLLPAARTVIMNFEAHVWQKAPPRNAGPLCRQVVAYLDQRNHELLSTGREPLYAEEGEEVAQ